MSYELDLSGEWWCGWQTWKDREPRIDTHTMEVHQRGELPQLDADRARPLEEAATGGAASYDSGTTRP